MESSDLWVRIGEHAAETIWLKKAEKAKAKADLMGERLRFLIQDTYAAASYEADCDARIEWGKRCNVAVSDCFEAANEEHAAVMILVKHMLRTENARVVLARKQLAEAELEESRAQERHAGAAGMLVALAKRQEAERHLAVC